MVKRNTNFKQMILADNTLIDVINSKLHSINNNTNNIGYIPYQNQSCVECDNSKTLEKSPFPEAIKDSNGNINTNFRVESSSNTESSSDDDENGDNNHNSINQLPTNNESTDSNYNSSNQRNTQTQPEDENVYNSLNQRIIQPLQDYSPNSSSDESDTDNLLNSRSEFSPQITENTPSNNILTQPNNTNQENSNAYINDPSPVEMDITNNRYQIRQQNEDLTSVEEPFTAPLPEEDFMDINISNISQPRRSIYKMKRLKSKIRMKQEDAKRKQQRRKEKMKLLKLKQQRLKQLYLENKSQKMEHLQPDDEIEDSIDNRSNANDDQPNDMSKSPAIRLRKFAYGTLPQQENLNKLDETNDVKEDNTKRPRIQVRKFAYGTMSEQENITKPEIRVAKFANQELIKDSRNLTNKLQYFCELCKIQFPKYSSLRQHLQENHEKKQYKIDFPNAGKYLALARKVKHKDDGSKFVYQNFNSNNDATSDLLSYWCSKCQKFFKNFQSMQSHMHEHEEGKTAVKRSNTRERIPKPNKKMFYEAY